jgi:hypothetical protein
MPLSKEQFSALRKQGLSVDQIVRFERGEKPAPPTPPPPPPPTTGELVAQGVG